MHITGTEGGLPGYYISYSIKSVDKFSTYDYQKIFRALYGYKQIVCKGGKRYVYYREGVLTRYPYIRRGRGSIIVPEEALDPLFAFFKTGRNPAHRWIRRGQWEVTFTMEEVLVPGEDILKAVWQALERIVIFRGEKPVFASQVADQLDPEEIKPLSNTSWFKWALRVDPRLKLKR